jgi:hypothetical protein
MMGEKVQPHEQPQLCHMIALRCGNRRILVLCWTTSGAALDEGKFSHDFNNRRTKERHAHDSAANDRPQRLRNSHALSGGRLKKKKNRQATATR